MTTAKRTHLGWLGPVIVIVGIVAAAVGTWYMVHARPVAGDVIDTIAIGGDRALIVRAEDGGERNFIELRDRDRVVWQAIVPPYAGRPGAPGIAWSELAVSVRVIRSGRAEVFAIAMENGSKLGGFKLAPGLGKVVRSTTGPVTLTDHVLSYEIVSGPGWSQLVAFDLGTGEARWRKDLGSGAIVDGGLANGSVWLLQEGRRRAFRTTDGAETSAAGSS